MSHLESKELELIDATTLLVVGPYLVELEM